MGVGGEEGVGAVSVGGVMMMTRFFLEDVRLEGVAGEGGAEKQITPF